MATKLGGAPLGYGGLGWSYPENPLNLEVTLQPFDFTGESALCLNAVILPALVFNGTSALYLEEVTLPTLTFVGASAPYLKPITLPVIEAAFTSPSTIVEFDVELPAFTFEGKMAMMLESIELPTFAFNGKAAMVLESVELPTISALFKGASQLNEVILESFGASFQSGSVFSAKLQAFDVTFAATSVFLTLNAVLTPFTFQGMVGEGAYAEFAISLPTFTAVFEGSGNIHGQLVVSLPAFAMYATLKSVTLVATAVSTKDGSLTEYSNYSFNSFATIAGMYLGAGDGGLVQLDGVNDMGIAIPASFETGLYDGESRNVKWMTNMKVVLKSNGSTKVRGVYDGVQKAQQTIPTTGGVLMPKNVNIDKGPTGILLGMQMESVAGAAFEVALIELLPELTKRIGK